GTFIFWRTNERLRSIRDLGNFQLPEPPDGDFINYVLDGQQRLTSLFATLKGLKLHRENGKSEDYADMYLDLNAAGDEQIVITDTANKDEKGIIRIMNLLDGDIELLASYPKEYHKKLNEYKQRIEAYHFPIIMIKDSPIDIATEIFTRINVSGKPLSLFEIMVAKTFDVEKNFDLAEKFSELIENLRTVNFETISDATVLQAISVILKKECKRKQILQLKKDKFIAVWDEVVDSIERSVEYFRSYYRIPVSQLLPYNALIVPFSYFFYHHKDKPTGDKQKYLQDFFWRCSLSGRYSSGVETKLAQDVKRIDNILNDKLPRYDWGIDVSSEFITNNGWFSASRSFIKAILCLFAYHQPKSFNDNSIINISNYWLKQANSKNYHHFFPKAYLLKKGWDYWDINHILNITIVDDFLNKREIKAKSPAVYMKRFNKQNSLLDATMKTHLITNLQRFGIWDNDYGIFLKRRAQAISRKLTQRIISQQIDKDIVPELTDDYEEVEIK
ncbi:MAG: DUF262 domain-containing protein, partial [bacterium]